MTYAFSLFNGVWLLGQDGLGLGRASGQRHVLLRPRPCPGPLERLRSGRGPGVHLDAACPRRAVRFLPESGFTARWSPAAGGGHAAKAMGGRTPLPPAGFSDRSLPPRLSSHKLLDLLDLFIPPLMPLLAALLLASTAVFLTGSVPGLLPLIPLLAFMALTFLFMPSAPSSFSDFLSVIWPAFP